MESSITSSLEKIITNAQTPTGGVFILSFLVLAGFVFIAIRLSKDSPLAPHALPLVGVMIIVPAAMFLGVTGTIDSNAVSAIIGAIVAYIFNKKTESQ